MKHLQQFDENLSDELLDEHVSVSSIKQLPCLDKNMSGSAFHSESHAYKFSKALMACNAESNKEDSSPNIRLEVCKDFRESRKIRSEMIPCKPSIQNDIKDLLHQAMRLKRKSHYFPSDEEHLEESKKSPKSRRQSYAREVTMKDIQKAQ